MNLAEALELLGIEDIHNLTKEDLKKIYRKLLKKYHPDANNGDDTKAKEVIKANEIILAALQEIESYKAMMKLMQMQSHCITSVIPLHTLINIYNGESITLGSGEDAVELNKNNIMKHNIFVMIDFNINITNEGTKHINKICKVEMFRNYEIVCDIELNELKAVDIEVNVLDVKRAFNMSADSVRLPILLDNDIRLILTIRKKIITGE